MTDRAKARAMVEAAERAAAPDRYGNVRIIKIKAAYDALRDAVRAGDIDAANAALDRYEQWADFAFAPPQYARGPLTGVQYTARESQPRSLRHTVYDYPTGNVTVEDEPKP